jgi:hypothetical protein
MFVYIAYIPLEILKFLYSTTFLSGSIVAWQSLAVRWLQRFAVEIEGRDHCVSGIISLERLR